MSGIEVEVVQQVVEVAEGYGPQGPRGAGVPEGGTTGQALLKASGDDFDTAWVDLPPGGGVDIGDGAANALLICDATGTVLARVAGLTWDPVTRTLVITSATVTSDAPALIVRQTWNNASESFVGVCVDISQTAAAYGRLQSWRWNAVERMWIDSGGNLYVQGAINGAEFGVSGGGASLWAGANDFRVQLASHKTGEVALTPSEVSDAASVKNGARQMKFRVYGRAVSDSDYVRLALNATPTALSISAEAVGGAADIPINIAGLGAAPVVCTRLRADGLSTSIATITAHHTVAATDTTRLIDATAGSVTITLPAAATANGRVLCIKKTDASGNVVTLDGNALETIDGATTKALTTQHQYVLIQCDGVSWHVIGGN